MTLNHPSNVHQLDAASRLKVFATSSWFSHSDLEESGCHTQNVICSDLPGWYAHMGACTAVPESCMSVIIGQQPRQLTKARSTFYLQFISTKYKTNRRVQYSLSLALQLG